MLMTQAWQNPIKFGLVRVFTSSWAANSANPSCVVGREVTRGVTNPLQDSRICVDLKDVRVIPEKYTLRHYISFDTECLCNWVLEGSNDTRDGDNGNWTLLKKHVNDQSINRKGASATFDIEPIVGREALRCVCDASRGTIEVRCYTHFPLFFPFFLFFLLLNQW